VPVVTLTGEIDMTNADHMRAAIEEQLNRHPVGIVVYLAVDFLASSGLSILVECNRRAQQTGIGFAVVATATAARCPITAIGLDQCWGCTRPCRTRCRRCVRHPRTNSPIPHIDSLQGAPPWQRSGVVNQAVLKVRDQAEERAASIKSRLDEFAAELSNESEFCAITAATTRKCYVTEWMADRADGFRLPSWFIDDLVGRARQAVKAAARPKSRAGSAVAAELPLG
jgi:anti-anti-sigma factor